MKAKVTTIIDGQNVCIIGKLSSDNKKITDKRGMVLFIHENDKIELIKPRKRETNVITACPFDLHKWFRVSKQL